MAKQPKKLFSDRVILWLDTPRLEEAIALARDMRSCTMTAAVTQAFFLAKGPLGIYSLDELGVTDIILSLHLLGSPKEIWQTALTAAHMGIKGITVSVMAGPENIRFAVEAAEAGRVATHRVNRMKVIVTPLPYSISDRTMIDVLGMRMKRGDHVTQTTKIAAAAGADAVLVEYGDIRYVKRAGVGMPYIVRAQKQTLGYLESEAPDVRKRAGISDIIKAKASHAVFDTALLGNTEAEWAADMIRKELETV